MNKLIISLTSLMIISFTYSGVAQDKMEIYDRALKDTDAYCISIEGRKDPTH